MNKTRNKNVIYATLILAFLAYIGNQAAYPLFYSVSFIFGSIAVVYASMTLPLLAVIFIAAIGGIYTLMAWGHPYALIIFILEAFWLAKLTKKSGLHIVLLDVLYWMIVGIPLVFIFYTQFIGLPFNAAAVISLKQTLNGIFNALIASFIYILIHVLWQKKQRIKIQPLLFNILLLITLIAGTIPTLISTNKTSNDYEKQINNELKRFSFQLKNIINLRAQQNISRENLFKNLPYSSDISVAILDRNNKKLYSSGHLKSLTSSKNSEIIFKPKGISIWLPDKSLPAMKRWQQGVYFSDNKTDSRSDIARIIVEKSAEETVTKVNQLKVELFFILSTLMLLAIFTSYAVSHGITRHIYKINKISKEVNRNIIQGNGIKFPSSLINEFANLSDTLNKMAAEIHDNYNHLNKEKTVLSEIVDKNTETVKRLSQVASRTTNIVIITNTQGEIEWVNKAFTRLTGFQSDEVVNKKPGDILQGAETNTETIKKISEKIQLKQRFSEEILNYTKYGEQYWVHIDCDPIFENNQLSGFIAIQSNITQRKKDEDKLIRRTARLNAVLQAATEIAVITTDINGIITMFNPGAEKMLGYNADELINIHSPAIFHLESEVVARGKELSQTFNKNITGFDAFITMANKDGSETREWTYIKKDGSHLIVLLSVTPITSSENEIVGYLGVAQDITERKRLDKLKKEFVSTVSHELRTPLTSINGALGLLSGGVLGEISKEMSGMLTLAQDNTNRLTILINDLLDIDKIASGKMVFDIRRHAISSLIRESIEMNTIYAKKYNVDYQLQPHCEHAEVEIDSSRFLQVMTNLLSNAAKFSHPGSHVDIIIECDSNMVKISVQDYGVGIDKNFFEHIFNKFSQADSSDTRTKGGTGLGLAISQEIIKNLNGTLGFDSQVNQGSVFWVEFPLLK